MPLPVIFTIVSNATYSHLRDSARAANRTACTGPAAPQFDAIATAQIVAIVEDCDSIFKLSALRQMYPTLMEVQGSIGSHTHRISPAWASAA